MNNVLSNEYYNNCHCHTHETNPIMPDSIAKTEDYIARALELGHKNIFTTEHGGSRDIYPVYGLCKKAGLKMIVGAEAYYTDDIYYSRHKDPEYVNRLFMSCFKVWKKKFEPQWNEKYFKEDKLGKALTQMHKEFETEDLLLFEDKKKRDKAFKAVFSSAKEFKDTLEESFYKILNKVKKLDRTNYHVLIVALNENGQEELNRILSVANIDGMYSKRPRVDLKLLLSLPKDDIIISTACVGGRLFVDNYKKKFLEPMLNHFGENFFLETQNHNAVKQIKWNQDILELKSEYGINLIHGCDSHYIYPEQAVDRDDFVKGKGVWFEHDDENTFILDYPSRTEIVKRYHEQGILSDKQIEETLNNTLVFDKAEDLNLNDDIKMPTIYPELTADERFEKLNGIVKRNLKKKLNSGVPKKKWVEYIKAVQFEMNIIKETSIPSVRTCDYFLINERIIDKGVNKYNGVLTRTGRGSGVSYLVNHLLGFTEIDRLDAEVPLYPTRFMSASRILESRSMPD